MLKRSSHRQVAVLEEDYKHWEMDIAEQIQEEKEYFEKNYRHEMKLYEEQKHLFEKQRDMKVHQHFMVS